MTIMVVIARIVVILLAVVCLLMSICGGVFTVFGLTGAGSGGGGLALLGFVFLIGAGFAAYSLAKFERRLARENREDNDDSDETLSIL